MRAGGAFEAELKLTYPDELAAKAIYDAVRPDNELLPQGLEIRALARGSSVELRVICRKSLESLQATIDDLLACVQAAERALKAIGMSRGQS